MTAPVLTLGADLALPLDVVGRKTAVLGMTGSGKTSTAVVMVEEAAAAGIPFVVLDPTSAWTGLRSSTDGDGPGLPVVIFGGDLGDVPLEASAGRYIARLIAERRMPGGVLLDMSLLIKADQLRFAHDFLDELYHLNRSSLLVVVDEAHRFAPQGAKDGGSGPSAHRAFVDAVTMGRRKGLGFIVVCPRPAKLAKDIFELCDVLIAHRLRGTNDRNAVTAWMDDSAADSEAAAWLARLPSLPTGTAIVSAPDLDLAGVFEIRMKRTFDSSATPPPGVAVQVPQGRAAVDLDEVRAAMAESIERQAEEDPAALRARISDLKRRLAEAQNAAPAESPSDDVVAAIREILDAAGYSKIPYVDDAVRVLVDDRDRSVTRAASSATRAYEDAVSMMEATTLNLRARLGEEPEPTPSAPSPAPARTSPATPEGEHAASTRVTARVTAASPLRGRSDGARAEQPDGRGSTSPTGVMPWAAVELAEILAAFPNGLPRERLALLAGRKPRGGSWNTAMKALREHGYAEDNGELLVPRQLALDTYPHAQPARGPALAEMWREKLSTAAVGLFDALLAAAPDSLSHEDLGGRTGRAPRGGSWNTAIKQLRTSGLVIEDGRRLRVDPDLTS